MEIFNGFPREGLEFLKKLAQNNNREWFQQHKETFKKYLEAPAKSFVEAMEMRFEQLLPGSQAVGGKIFRIYRDIRFSKDKTPYKTHIGICFTEGKSKYDGGCSQPIFYFHLAPPKLTLGAGVHKFSREMLDSYRDAVVDDEKGAELSRVIDEMEGIGYEVKGTHYKRVPHNYDKDHPRAELLLHNRLYISYTAPLPKVISSPDLVEHSMNEYKKMRPVNEWLKAL